MIIGLIWEYASVTFGTAEAFKHPIMKMYTLNTYDLVDTCWIFRVSISTMM